MPRVGHSPSPSENPTAHDLQSLLKNHLGVFLCRAGAGLIDLGDPF